MQGGNLAVVLGWGEGCCCMSWCNWSGEDLSTGTPITSKEDYMKGEMIRYRWRSSSWLVGMGVGMASHPESEDCPPRCLARADCISTIWVVHIWGTFFYAVKKETSTRQHNPHYPVRPDLDTSINTVCVLSYEFEYGWMVIGEDGFVSTSGDTGLCCWP